MSTKYYSCQLLTDIIINASLATEGNMKTLDYIPGSNFWGIVAGKHYKDLVEQKEHQQILDLFHNGTVSFGDAHIALDGKLAYPIPISLFRNKLEPSMLNDPVYLHHALVQRKERLKDEAGKNIQLKQHRTGYFTPDYFYLSGIRKRFALKSAQDRTTRKSKDGQMFGFESIQAGQTFIFAVRFKDEKYVSLVDEALIGNRKVGKSKNAQYGQVNIQDIKTPQLFTHQNTQEQLLLIYALSNICLIDEFGNNTLQPEPKRDFGIDGTIDWAASQIRTYSYSPWNNHRKTSDQQRDCIQKGSVIAIRMKQAVDVFELDTTVGAYQAEGLGQVLYNPVFLQADRTTAKWSIKLQAYEESKVEEIKEVDIKSSLGLYLSNQKRKADEELIIGHAVLSFLKTSRTDFDHISNSQWGVIRSAAAKASSIKDLQQKLFGTHDKAYLHYKPNKEERQNKVNKGLLTQGVAAQRYWDKKGGKAREALWEAIEKNKSKDPKHPHRDAALVFLAKFATEKAKKQKSN